MRASGQKRYRIAMQIYDFRHWLDSRSPSSPSSSIPTDPFHLARWIEPLDAFFFTREQKQWQSFNAHQSERQHLPQSFPIFISIFPFLQKEKKNSHFSIFHPETLKNGLPQTKKVRVQQPTVWPISVSMMDRWLDKVSFCIYTSRLVRMKQGRRGPTRGKKM